jgi:DNA-directed RNA polymerase sigma subunit (sigma70/sigma32)
MAGWLIPALRAVLPHVGDIVSMAKPVFTKKNPDAVDPGTLQQQIAELQAAASQNAANVKELAEQLQRTVTALEQAGALAEARLRRVIVFCAVAVSLSVIALGAAMLSYVLR